MTALVGALIVATATVAQSPVDPPVHRHALIIGNNASWDSSREPLRFADDDAARFYELFGPAAQSAHLLTVLDAPSQTTFPSLVPLAKSPTLDNLERVVSRIERAVQADRAAGHRTELYFVYAGHGDIADGVGYVHLVDGRLMRPQLQRLLRRIKADTTHVIIDACKSYYMVAGRGPGGRRERISKSFAGPQLEPDIGYVLSTSSDADAHEWAALSGGIFSHEIRSALVGAADANADNSVTYQELGAFIAAANQGVPNPVYKPKVFIRSPPKNKLQPLYRPSWLQPAMQLEIPKDAAGRISIIDERGLRYADVNKAQGAPLSLSLLQPRVYEVRWAGKVATVDKGRGRRSISALSLEDQRISSRGVAHRAFERLFSFAFGKDVVRGYQLALDTMEPGALPRLSGAARAPPIEKSSGWRYGMYGASLGLLVTSTVLSGFYVDTRVELSAAPQLERKRLASRADGLLGGAVSSVGLGIVAFAVGLLIFD